MVCLRGCGKPHLQACGRLPEAVDTYHEAVTLYRELCGEEHLSTAAALANVGLAMREQAAATRGVERVCVVCCVCCS